MNIYYHIKNTSATTDYLKIDNLNDLITELLAMHLKFGEMVAANEEDHRLLVAWYRKPSSDLPRTRTGTRNSPETLIAGILTNLIIAQTDLTLIQSQHIENITEVANRAYETLGTPRVESIKFTEKYQ